MRFVLALLLALPLSALADGHHPKPEQKPVQTPPRCSCWWQPAIVAGALTGGIVFLVYKSEDNKKKAELAPTEDGRGIRLVSRMEF